MFLHLRIWLVVALGILVCAPAWAAKEDHGTFHLDVQFVNGSKERTEAQIKASVAAWVAKAEQFYQRRPDLKIDYTIVRQTQKGGRDLSQLRFKSAAEYVEFMNDNFDNVATSKTEGHFTVLITDDLGWGRGDNVKDWDGYAFLPHWVYPFSTKRGIALDSDADENILAHELGHVFGLKHTFEPYVGFNLQCNDDFRPKGRPGGECNSCLNGTLSYDADGLPSKCKGAVNLMDYCTSEKDKYTLNTCQEQRAAHQRYVYMTVDGKTNYFRLKGLTGEAACEEDADCEDGTYCNTGVAGVGRNLCKAVNKLGDACTRGGQCASGRCSGLRCATADECAVDGDCGSGRYCNKGIVGLGRNTCETKLTDGRACTGGNQCSSGDCSEWRPQDGQASGICFVPASKDAGESCVIDNECKAGKCNSNKKCVCKADSDCGSGQWCDGGVDTKENVCRNKLDAGEVCGAVGEFGTGHRCKSGSCKIHGVSTKLTCGD